jgi:hypothetical protein
MRKLPSAPDGDVDVKDIHRDECAPERIASLICQVSILQIGESHEADLHGEVDNGFLIGGAIGAQISENFRAEVEVSHARLDTKTEVEDYVLYEPTLGRITVRRMTTTSASCSSWPISGSGFRYRRCSRHMLEAVWVWPMSMPISASASSKCASIRYVLRCGRCRQLELCLSARCGNYDCPIGTFRHRPWLQVQGHSQRGPG